MNVNRVCNHRRNDPERSVCGGVAEYTVRAFWPGVRKRSLVCGKHVGKAVERRMVLGGAERVTVHLIALAPPLTEQEVDEPA